MSLPRILCLHGGGTNSTIFRAQCRVLIAQLKTSFRLVFADAPFPSTPGPDVVSVYKEFGPFRRWIRSTPEDPQIDARVAIAALDDCLHAAMEADDLQGGRGEWVGILGFSQGAKIAASLLLRQQLGPLRLAKTACPVKFRFGVLMAGSGPLVALDAKLLQNEALVSPSDVRLLRAPTAQCLARQEHVLRVPTIHVHGIRDAGIERHRHLLENYCSSKSSRLIEWDGDHRIPIKTKDVAAMVREILRVSQETGVLKRV